MCEQIIIGGRGHDHIVCIAIGTRRIHSGLQVQFVMPEKFFQLGIGNWRLARIDQIHPSCIYIHGNNFIILGK